MSELVTTNVEQELLPRLLPSVAKALEPKIVATIGQFNDAAGRRRLTMNVGVATAFEGDGDRAEAFTKHAVRLERLHNAAPGGLRGNIATVTVPRYGGGFFLVTLPHILAKTVRGPELPPDLERWVSNIQIEPSVDRALLRELDDTGTYDL